MDNIINLGRIIYKIDCNYMGTHPTLIVYSTYPNRNSQTTISIIYLETKETIDARTIYTTTKKEDIEEWIINCINPIYNPKLIPMPTEDEGVE